MKEKLFEKLQETEHLSIKLAKTLEDTDDQEFVKENMEELLDLISKDLNVEIASDVRPLYKGMEREKCLVRVDQLSRVLETLEAEFDDKPLKISDEKESHYANAVIPEPKGIKIAFSEGQAPGPVRMVFGFGKTIVGFKTENISVTEIDFQESEIRDSEERRYLCRHVSGELKKSDIRYIIIRIPFVVATNILTIDEQNKKTRFYIQRI